MLREVFDLLPVRGTAAGLEGKKKKTTHLIVVKVVFELALGSMLHDCGRLVKPHRHWIIYSHKPVRNQVLLILSGMMHVAR